MSYIDEEIVKEKIANRINNSVIQGWLNKIINDIPISGKIELKHGKWKVVYQNKKATVYECSECGHLAFGISEYCICGTKMDKKD